MKIIKNILRSMGLGRLVILFAMVFVINIFSMKVSEMPKMAARIRIMQNKKKRDREKKYEKGKYLIYERNTSNGILVNAEEAKRLSSTIKNMVIDLGHEPKEIRLPFSANIIKLGFDILNNKENNSLFVQLMDVGNFFDYLEVSDNVWNNLLGRIKKVLEDQSDIKSINESFGHLKKLAPDLQKLLMTIPTINFLRTFIISRIAKYTKLIYDQTITSAAFNFDGTQFAIGCSAAWLSHAWLSQGSNGIVWNEDGSRGIGVGIEPASVLSVAFSPYSDPDSDANFLVMVGEPSTTKNNLYMRDFGTYGNKNVHPGTIRSVAFLSSTRVVLGCDGNQDNLKIFDLERGKMLFAFTAPHAVNSVACSVDGKLIISGCEGNEKNLVLWDISNVDWDRPQNTAVIQKDISDTSFNNVTCLALAHDGSKFVSGSRDGSLILWDIEVGKKFGNVSKQLLARHTVSVNSVAFSHDNKNILVGLSGSKSNVELWDISNRKNITHNAFDGIWNNVNTVVFSPDDKKFLVGGKSSNMSYLTSLTPSSLILWDNLTDEQTELLNKLKDNVDQLRLIYKLCLISLKGKTKNITLDEEEKTVFNSLENDMKSLLSDLSLVKQ